MDEEKVSNRELIEKLREPRSEVKKGKSTALLGLLAVLVAMLLVASYMYRAYGFYTISEETIHWHAHLIIKRGGKAEVIPPSVGLLGDSTHPANLHTHVDDNVIHMEIPGPVRAMDVMLGRFFEVWQKDFGRPDVLIVNGLAKTDFERYIMRDHDELELIYE